ncbi:MAG: PilZ domain-containing protein [Candidatus Omnitrophota bacterium]
MDDLESKLISCGLITAQQALQAEKEALACGKALCATLVKLGFVTEEDMVIFFANESSVPYIRVSDYCVSPQALALLDENFCRQHLVIPVFKVNDVLFVAVSNPLDTALMDNIFKITGCDIEPLIASCSQILSNLNLYYGPEDEDFDIERYIIKQSAIKRVPFHRESERLDLKIPVSVTIDDKNFALRGSSSVDGFTQNISNGGAAIGMEVFFFLPKGVNLILEFKPHQDIKSAEEIIKVKGQVVHSFMGKNKKFFLGIQLYDMDRSGRNRLLKLASQI